MITYIRKIFCKRLMAKQLLSYRNWWSCFLKGLVHLPNLFFSSTLFLSSAARCFWTCTIYKKNPGRRRRKKGPFWGNMAGINLEILFYLIWTKLLVWTRCPQQAGTQPPQPRWARSGLQICHYDHGVHMNPWLFNSSPFMQFRSTSLLSLDFIFDPETVSQEEPDIFLLFSPLLRLSCMFACLRKTEEEQKENQEHANAEKDMPGEYEKWTYLIPGVLLGIKGHEF